MLTFPNHRILVVDDLADNLFLMQAVLEAEGYEVATASSGQAALTTLKINFYDLILLDVMMPDMNGFEVMRQIREIPDLRAIPILLITAHDYHSLGKDMGLSADNFIRKPVDFDQLLLKLEQLLQPDSNRFQRKLTSPL